MSASMELVPFTSELAPKDVAEDVLSGDADKKDVMTEKDKRRLEILLLEDTPQLHVDPSIISRLNVIDRELHMLKGERLKEVSRRSVSPQDEDVMAICDNGWNEAQNRLDQIEEAVAQTRIQKHRLLPLRDSKNLLNTITITEDISEEDD